MLGIDNFAVPSLSVVLAKSLHQFIDFVSAFLFCYKPVFFKFHVIFFNLKSFKSMTYQSFHYTCFITRSVERVCGAYLRVTAPGRLSSFQRNIAAVASRWEHCVRFDRPGI